MKLLGLKALLI